MSQSRTVELFKIPAISGTHRVTMPSNAKVVTALLVTPTLRLVAEIPSHKRTENRVFHVAIQYGGEPIPLAESASRWIASIPTDAGLIHVYE